MERERAEREDPIKKLLQGEDVFVSQLDPQTELHLAEQLIDEGRVEIVHIWKDDSIIPEDSILRIIPSEPSMDPWDPKEYKTWD